MKRRANSRRITVICLLIAFAALVPSLVWLLSATVAGWSQSTTGVAVALAAALAGGIANILGQPLFASILPPVTDDVAPGTTPLDRWQFRLSMAITARPLRPIGGLRGLEAPTRHTIDMPARDDVRLLFDDGRSQRLRVSGRARPWTQVSADYEAAPCRLLILAEPGYGKTVAAHDLVRRINLQRPLSHVAEVLSVADWYHWWADDVHEGIDKWIVSSIVRRYRPVPPEVVDALISDNRFVPAFDGLDELPYDARVSFMSAIGSYTSSSNPFRPFILTSRMSQYLSLPMNFEADKVVVLPGLEQEDILRTLETRTGTWSSWHALRQRVADGDGEILRFFRSPLRLELSLTVYGDSIPSDLLTAPSGSTLALEGQLWERLIALPTVEARKPSFEDRTGLRFLASGMKRLGREKFFLHELPAYVPESLHGRRLFQTSVTVLAATLLLLIGLSVGPAAAATGVISGILVGGASRTSAPPALFKASWQTYIRREPLWRYRRLLIFSLTSFSAGLWTWNASTSDADVKVVLIPLAGLIGLAVGLALALAALLLSVAPEMLFGLSSTEDDVIVDPPNTVRARKPNAVVNNALKTGASYGGLAGLFALFVTSEPSTGSQVDHLPTRLFVVLCVALFFGTSRGLGFWMYYSWLRLNMRMRGILPFRLESFLERCTESGWIRESDGYEFRHVRLREHLSADVVVEHDTSTVHANDGARFVVVVRFLLIFLLFCLAMGACVSLASRWG